MDKATILRRIAKIEESVIARELLWRCIVSDDAEHIADERNMLLVVISVPTLP